MYELVSHLILQYLYTDISPAMRSSGSPDSLFGPLDLQPLKPFSLLGVFSTTASVPSVVSTVVMAILGCQLDYI